MKTCGDVQVSGKCCAVPGFEGCSERSKCVGSNFCDCVLGVHCVFAFQQMPPRRRGERRDERLSSIGVGAGRGARKSHILFCRAVWARGSQKKMLTMGRPVRMRRKKRRSSGSGIPEAGGMRIRPLPSLSAAHHDYVFGALRGVPAEVGRGKTPGLRLPRWGEGFLPFNLLWLVTERVCFRSRAYDNST